MGTEIPVFCDEIENFFSGWLNYFVPQTMLEVSKHSVEKCSPVNTKRLMSLIPILSR